MHQLSTTSFNFWEWHLQATQARKDGNRVVYKAWSENMPPGWFPHVGSWQPEIRSVPADAYSLLFGDGCASHTACSDGCRLVPTAELSDFASRFPVHSGAKLLKWDEDSSSGVGHALSDTGAGDVQSRVGEAAEEAEEDARGARGLRRTIHWVCSAIFLFGLACAFCIWLRRLGWAQCHAPVFV